MKSEQTDSGLLRTHYGFSRQKMVLHALRRDSLWAQQDHLQDVYERPNAEVLTANRNNCRHHLEEIIKFNEMDALQSDKRVSITAASLHTFVKLQYRCCMF